MGTYRDIHIGNFIKQSIVDQSIELTTIQLFFDYTASKIEKIYSSESIPTHELMKWCIFLRTDFFRLYSGHLMLHRGISGKPKIKKEKTGEVIKIRKNMYTQEIKQFIVEQIRNKDIKVKEAIIRYNIPKTTIYKWLHQI